MTELTNLFDYDGVRVIFYGLIVKDSSTEKGLK